MTETCCNIEIHCLTDLMEAEKGPANLNVTKNEKMAVDSYYAARIIIKKHLQFWYSFKEDSLLLFE